MVINIMRILGRRKLLTYVNLATFFVSKRLELWVSCMLTPPGFKSLLTAACQGVKRNVLFMSSIL